MQAKRAALLTSNDPLLREPLMTLLLLQNFRTQGFETRHVDRFMFGSESTERHYAHRLLGLRAEATTTPRIHADEAAPLAAELPRIIGGLLSGPTAAEVLEWRRRIDDLNTCLRQRTAP